MNKNTPESAARQSINVKIVTITPSMAKKLLANNTHNRRIVNAKVKLWSESMLRGEWRMNAEPIKIAADGTILDGQHRLLAGVATGVSFPSMIVSGLPIETQDTMDIGRKRTLGDVLSLHGYKNANNLAAILSAVIIWNKLGPSSCFSIGHSSIITNGEALEYLAQHQDIAEVPNIVQTPARNSGISQRVLGALYVKFREVEPSKVDEFLELLSTGAGLPKKDPILTLRKTVKRLRDLNHGTQVSPRYIAAITIKAWNKWINGDTASLLRFTTTGDNKESFPKIQKSLDSITSEKGEEWNLS